MLNRTISEQYDSLRSAPGTLERSGDSNEPWIAQFKRTILERIAALGRIEPVSVAKSDCQILAEQLRTWKRADENQTSHEIVLLSGTLAKPGSIANCIVKATKVTVPGLQDSEYRDATIVLAPRHLANGQYELHFEGRRVWVRNNAGRWSTSVCSEHSAIPATVVKDGHK